jgi:hypothetical protein
MISGLKLMGDITRRLRGSEACHLHRSVGGDTRRFQRHRNCASWAWRPGFMTVVGVTESVVEQAALAWLENLGCRVTHGLEIASGEAGAERADYA